MQVYPNGKKIPTADIKVGDFIFAENSHPFYVSSIKKCTAPGSWESYLKFRVKILGDSSKDPIYTEFTSYSVDFVEFFNHSAMHCVIRLEDKKEINKINASWKKFVSSVSKSTCIIDISRLLYEKHSDYYSAIEIITKFESVGHIRKLITSYVENAIYMLSRESIQLQLGIDAVQYTGLVPGLVPSVIAVNIAKLLVAGESYDDIYARVNSWKLAYDEMCVARLRMEEAFILPITHID